MFLQKDDVKEKVREIILDEHDNDIVFVVAAKGIGKLRLLEELFDIESSNREIIVANGSRIHNAASCLSKCYIDGICSYIEKHNYRDCPNEKSCYQATFWLAMMYYQDTRRNGF